MFDQQIKSNQAIYKYLIWIHLNLQYENLANIANVLKSFPEIGNIILDIFIRCICLYNEEFRHDNKSEFLWYSSFAI